MSLQDLTSSVEDSLHNFVVSASKINQIVHQHSLLVKEAFHLQLKYIDALMHSAKSLRIHARVRQYIAAVQKFRDDNSSSKYFNHLNAVYEGILVLLWISTQTDPVSYIRDVEICVRFYTDRIVREWNDQHHHIEWVKAWMKLISDVEKLSKKYKPLTISSHAFKIKASELHTKSASNSIETMASITDLPSCRCEGNHWIIENQRGTEKITLKDTEADQAIYIRNCKETDIVIKGKVNSIVMDKCKSTTIVFDSLVSSIEFVNCESIQMQVLDEVSTILVHRTDGCEIYLCSTSVNSEIITSLSTQVNVLVPSESGEYKVLAIPEQFKTILNPDIKLETTPFDVRAKI